jgi:hypothetical protein
LAISITTIQQESVAAIRSYVRGLRRLEITPPYEIFVTLIGCRDAIYHQPSEIIEESPAFPLDVVPTTGVLLQESPDDDDQAVAALLRPAFDEIANAAGLCASPGFDATGRWLPGKQH